MRYVLPKGLTCSQCVLQWRYIAGNNWGKCENGTEAVGCGPQEEFRACADIAVLDSAGAADETPYIDNETDVDDTSNEIDSNGTDEGITGDEQGSSFLFISTIILFVLALLFTAIFLVYVHFYRGKEFVKEWWSQRSQNFSVDRIKQFSWWKYFSKNKVTTEKPKSYQTQPIPPPRIKRTTSIGFVGVPDNLV